MVNSTITILAIKALTGNRALGSWANNVQGNEGIAICGKRRWDLRRRLSLVCRRDS